MMLLLLSYHHHHHHHPRQPVLYCVLCLQAATHPADAAESLLSSDGATLLVSALQASMADGAAAAGAATLQHQVLAALNAVLHTDNCLSSTAADLSQLMAALDALQDSADASVASSARAAAGRISSSVACGVPAC